MPSVDKSRLPNRIAVAPILRFVRHAQGYHNLSVVNHTMRDPLLTELGEQQCHKLNENFPFHSTVSLVVASPLRRTIYTALLGFPAELGRGLRVVALPEAQETTAVPCDTGLDAVDLQKEFEGKPVDLSLVQDGWNSKMGTWSPDPNDLKARAKAVRRWLKKRPEEDIVLVTHGGFLHYLTEDWSDFNDVTGTGWVNTEFRSYKFVDEDDSDNASIVETKESSKARRGPRKPLTMTDQLALVRTRSSESGKDGTITSKV